eukprot:1183495-Prorocentrum_minimum.AAC.2
MSTPSWRLAPAADAAQLPGVSWDHRSLDVCQLFEREGGKRAVGTCAGLAPRGRAITCNRGGTGAAETRRPPSR